jgi:hypothetical protein
MAIDSDEMFSPKGSGTTSLYSIPLSTTGEDGKAAVFQIADEKGTALISANAATGTTTIGGLAATSAVLTTPNIGTPSSGNLVNCTGLSYSQMPLPNKLLPNFACAVRVTDLTSVFRSLV